MLEETQAESESHQAALRDCQDMLEELQTFSQGRETRLQALQQELQVALRMHVSANIGTDCLLKLTWFGYCNKACFQQASCCCIVFATQFC